MGKFDVEFKQFASALVKNEGKRTDKVINKSSFDKTYAGRVIDRYPTDTNKEQTGWLVNVGDTTYIVLKDKCNITATGQNVRCYIPNNNRSNIYAEVIENVKAESLQKIEKISDNEVHAIYETYKEIWTAEGSGNERHDFKVEVVDI